MYTESAKLRHLDHSTYIGPVEVRETDTGMRSVHNQRGQSWISSLVRERLCACFCQLGA